MEWLVNNRNLLLTFLEAGKSMIHVAAVWCLVRAAFWFIDVHLVIFFLFFYFYFFLRMRDREKDKYPQQGLIPYDLPPSTQPSSQPGSRHMCLCVQVSGGAEPTSS